MLPAAAIAAGSVLVSTAVATQAPATAEQTQQSAQKAYDGAAKAASGAQAKADASRQAQAVTQSAATQAKGSVQTDAGSAATNAQSKADEAKKAADANRQAAAGAASEASQAQQAADKAASDAQAAKQQAGTVTAPSDSEVTGAQKASDAASSAATDAQMKADDAKSTADAAATDAKSKSDAAQVAKDALDAARKAYEAATKGDPMTVAQFLDSISNGKYSEWAKGTYYDISDKSVTNKANGSNMTYDNFLAALQLIDHLNQYRTTHGLDALTVSGYEMAGQMLECDLVDDGVLAYHTSFWGYAWFKDLAWGCANYDYVSGKGKDAVDAWLSERDDFKEDAEAYATNGYKVADGKYTPASDEYKAALAAVDWSSEPSIHAFYSKYVYSVNAYCTAWRGAPREYGHWASLTNPSVKYIGMGYSTSDPDWGTAEAAAGHTSPADGDVTGTTDYFRTLVAEAKAGKATEDPALRAKLDAAQTAHDKAKAASDAAAATLANAQSALAKAQGAYDAATKDAQSKAMALAKAQSASDAAKSALEKAQTAYDTAKAASDAADAKAQSAQADADTAAKVAADAKAGGEAAKAKLAEAKDALSKAEAALKDAQSKATEAATAKAQAASDLEAAKATAETARQAAEAAKADADQKAADEAKATADDAKAALDDANRELALKQAIDRAMAGSNPAAGGTARGAAAHAAGTRLVGPASRAYAPRHMAAQAASALPQTGDADVLVAPLAAVGFISLASAAGMRRRRRD